MPKPKLTLRQSYWLLVGAAAGSVVAYAFLSNSFEGPKSFLLNLSTEIVGILLTVWLIDSVIRRREAEEQRRYRAVALRRLHHPLSEHVRLLSLMYKASVKEGSENPSWELEGFTKEDFRNQLAHLDLLGPSPAVRGFPSPMSQEEPEPVPWFDYLHGEAKKFKEQLERVIDKYSMQLDSETAGVIEDLANSPLIGSAHHFPSMAQHHQAFANSQGVYIPLTTLALPGDTVIQEHAGSFVQLVHFYNEAAPEEHKIPTSGNQLWRDDMAPSIGSARAPVNYLDPNTGETITET